MTDDIKLSKCIMKDEEEEAFPLYQEDVHMSLVHYSNMKAVSVGLKKGEWQLRKHFQQGNEGEEGFV